MTRPRDCPDWREICEHDPMFAEPDEEPRIEWWRVLGYAVKFLSACLAIWAIAVLFLL